MDKTVSVEQFSRISARGEWEITITQGPFADVALSYEDDVEKRISYKVKDGQLRLNFEAKRWSLFGKKDKRACVKITIPDMSALELYGSSLVKFSGFCGESLILSATGASEVTGTESSYKRLQLDKSGANKIDLSETAVDNAHISITGTGKLAVLMNGGELTGKFSGMGEVIYGGTVSRESVEVMGMANIRPLQA